MALTPLNKASAGSPSRLSRAVLFTQDVCSLTALFTSGERVETTKRLRVRTKIVKT